MNDNPINKESDKQNSNGGKDVQNDELARKLRTSMLAVLIFFMYALLAVLSTTDMMLLRKGAIALPIIQASVPVVAFYVIAPLFLVLLHLHLLAKLILFAGEIYDTKKTPHEVYGWFGRVLIILFSFEQERLILAMKYGNFLRVFMRIFFLMIFGAIPLLVLLILQARFIAYQNEGIALYHQLLITLDLVFQFLFMLSFSKLWGGEKKFLRGLRYLIISVLIAIPAYYVWAVALIPDSYIENKVKSDRQQSIAKCFFPDWWKVSSVQHSHIANEANSVWQQLIERCFFLDWWEDKLFINGERFIDIPNEVITFRDPPPEIVGATIRMEGKHNPMIHCEHVGELDLSVRSLNFANFTGSKFLCVKMQNTQLNNSNLVDVDLSEANLTGANLTGANLRVARLGGAVLNSAKLNKANLAGAILNKALLKGADLSEAELRGAKLIDVQLVTAKLNKADLSDADLSDADLRGADLSEAKLSRAKLSTAIFVGANLSGANLSGADLSDADLSGANLSGANLSGADLSGAKLYGARLYEAQLSDTTLEGAKLYGANFSGSTLRGTSLDKADGNEPKGWATILYKIKRGLKLGGLSQGKIDSSVAMIVRSSTLTQGYVSSTGTDHCDRYVGKPEQDLPVKCKEK